MQVSANRIVARFITLTAAFTFALAAQVCVAQDFEPQLPNPGNTRMSRQQQQQIGFQTATEVYKQMPVLPDSSPETRYVRSIGHRLVAAIPAQYSWPFEFHVVASKEINAFALPGGEMFVNLGAITAASDEAELAGVMAHEMSHVYMQHSAKQMEKEQIAQGLAGLAGAIFGNTGGMLGTLGQAGIQMGAGMVMLKYSRGDEAQADAVGAMIMYRAGYNPHALADFFKKLEAQGGAGPQFLSDHPNPGNRDEAIQREVQNWPPINYRSDNAAFTQARREALAARAYTSDEISTGAKSGRWTALNKQNGAILNPPPGISASSSAQSEPSGSSTSSYVRWSDVAPSSSFTLTDFGLMRMVRPTNWEVVVPQQQGQFISIAPRAGIVNNGVGYGVMMKSVTPNQQESLDQTTQNIVQSLQSGQSALQQIDRIAQISVAGVRGRSVNLQSTSPFTDANGQPQSERDHLVTIPRPDGSVVFLVFIAPVQDYGRISPAFDRMLRSIEF